MYENRRHIRIHEIVPVRWTVLGTDVIGEGKVLNVSSSGLLLQTKTPHNLIYSGVLYIDAHGPESLEFGPKKGKVMWSRRTSDGQDVQYGIEFVKGRPQDKALDEWINVRSNNLTEIVDAKILEHYIK